LTELADKGINVRVIQALARHKDMSTTQRYITTKASCATLESVRSSAYV
jgi:site-specific recombinase XerD